MTLKTTCPHYYTSGVLTQKIIRTRSLHLRVEKVQSSIRIHLGLHLATLQVVDNDGASTESLIIPIEIVNLEPQIGPVADPLPVAEDSEISITIDTIDTAGDRQASGIAMTYNR